MFDNPFLNYLWFIVFAEYMFHVSRASRMELFIHSSFQVGINIWHKRKVNRKIAVGDKLKCHLINFSLAIKNKRKVVLQTVFEIETLNSVSVFAPLMATFRLAY